MVLNAQMALLRRPTFSALLLGWLLFMYNLNLALASSGGVMGGSFFHSDSSPDESFMSNSKPVVVVHDNPSSPDDAEPGRGGSILFLIFMFGFLLVGFCRDTNGNTAVLKLQVVMLGGMGSSIQRDLNRIAEAADTSSREGVSYLLTETILALLGHPDGYCVSGYSSVNLKSSRQDGEKCYNQISNEERAKFDEETLVNLNKIQKLSTRSQNTVLDVKVSIEEGEKLEEETLLNGFGNEFIVITILVAVIGAHKLPTINGAEDLKEALQKLKSLPSSKLLAGEVLWTPQKEDDTLSERELLEDYPKLAKGLKSFLMKKHE